VKLNNGDDQLFSSDDFVKLAEKHIASILELLISGRKEFSIIVKPKYILMKPDLDIFQKPEEYVKFDLIGYSFETSEVIKDKFIFRAGFGQDKNIRESEVSMNLKNIFQIVTIKSKPIFMNFSEPSETKKIDRSKMFMSKNRNLGKTE